MQADLSWDEFRLVKAIAETRSLMGAAERLNLNHSTIFRRLGAIEKSLGLRLFERSRTGYQPTAAGEEMIEIAASMSESILEFERRVSGRDIKPSGELRITTVDSIGAFLLPDICRKFHERFPDVRIDLNFSQQLLNLSRREADIAIRATNQPPETLVGRRLSTARWGIYFAPKLEQRFPGRLIEDAPWISFGDSFGGAPPRRWIDKHVPAKNIVFRLSSVAAMPEVIASGLGVGLLPCFVGDRRPDLVQIHEDMSETDVGIWILTHPDLRYSAKVRAFMEFAGNEIVKQRKLLEGVRPEAQCAVQELART